MQKYKYREDSDGVIPSPSVDHMSKDINSKLNYISQIEFSITSYLVGCEDKTFVILGDKVIIHTEREYRKKDFDKISYDEEICKERIVSGLQTLNVLKWRRNYVPPNFDFPICVTVSWYLNIYFSDGHRPVKICGCNNYPHNFEGLLKLFDIDVK